jgi:hypothetical protein
MDAAKSDDSNCSSASGGLQLGVIDCWGQIWGVLIWSFGSKLKDLFGVFGLDTPFGDVGLGTLTLKSDFGVMLGGEGFGDGFRGEDFGVFNGFEGLLLSLFVWSTIMII